MLKPIGSHITLQQDPPLRLFRLNYCYEPEEDQPHLLHMKVLNWHVEIHW